MTKYKRSLEWENLAEGMKAHLLSASDEHILKTQSEEGHSPEEVADSTRDLMLKSVNRFRRQRLESARQTISKAPPSSGPRLPASVYSATPQQRRVQLRIALQQQPEVTAQFRQLEQMTDEDVLSALEDLAALREFSDDPKEDS